jgi:hypothetical protein
MKKMRNERDLQQKIRQLSQREKELKRVISADWHGLKQSLDPVALAKDAWNRFRSKEEEKSQWTKDALLSGLALLGKKAIMGLWEKLASKFNK